MNLFDVYPPGGFWSSLGSTLGVGSNSPIGTTFQTLDNDTSKIEKISSGSWKALGSLGENMQGATVCFPANGVEVVRAVQGADCAVVMLTRNYFDAYQIATEMIVSTPKVIMGNPLLLPALNGTKIDRLFHGKPIW